MIKEYFVSYDVGMALKAVGFDEPCPCYYSALDGYVRSVGDSFIPGYRNSLLVGIENYAKPTIQMAIAWLEQEHHIYVMVAPYQPGKWKVCLVYTNDPHPDDGKLCLCELDGIHNSYPDAANFGLMSAIEIVSKVLKAKGGNYAVCK